MNKKIVLSAVGFLLFLGSTLFSLHGTSAASIANGKTLVLYDAASGTIPAGPFMGFTDFPPGVALPSYSDGLTLLDTTVAGADTYAGWVSNGATTPGFPLLDRMEGFQVNFSLQVKSESHNTAHRAGFSLIVLSEDARGIELAFWENEVWAQSDDATGGLFRHGEGAAFATTAGLTEYQLAIVGDTYTLTANGNPLLSGPVRDYSAFDGFPDPYETPNFLFLGDDTTSAQARVQLRFLAVTGTEPVTTTSTNTSVSTGTASPVASPTPLPTATPMPSPTPAGRAFELCPSGWIILMGAFTTTKILKKIRAGR